MNNDFKIWCPYILCQGNSNTTPTLTTDIQSR